MPSLADLSGWLKEKGIALADLVNSGATPQTQAMSGMSLRDIFHAVANPDAVLNSPAASMGSGFAPIGMAGVMTYHGTPHKFDSYDLSKIGTGEGAQVYGHGMYFAENPQTANAYKNALSKFEVKTPERAYQYGYGDISSEEREAVKWADLAFGNLAEAKKLAQKQANSAADATDKGFYGRVADTLDKWSSEGAKAGRNGKLYKQDLPDEVLPRMLQWDKPLSEQPASVQGAINKAFADAGIPNAASMNPDGQSAHAWLSAAMGGGNKASDKTLQARASELLLRNGVPGVSYLDAGSRGAGQGTMNHVVWDQGLLNRMRPQAVE